jgi:hypothetical protein
MKKNKIDFRTSAYFPTGMILAGVLFIFIGFGVTISGNALVGIIITLAGTVMLTTHYRLEIDFENKRYKDYVWLLGMKKGELEQFEKIEYLFIKKSRLSQNLNSLVSTRTISKDAFNGYLKLNGGEPIHLLTKVNKSVLVSRLNKIADALHVKVVDYSADR